MTLKEFKKEFRLICTDTWGNTLEAWFECAAHLNEIAYPPKEWEYEQKGSGKDKDSYWYEFFDECDADELLEIGNFLFRYCSYLKFKGISY